MRLVVIGGDAAGMSAASQARRTAPATELSIVAFERGPRTSYAACGLPYYVGGLVASANDLVSRTPEQFAERGIEVHTRHEVTGIDTTRRTVTVRDLERGSEREEPWDELVVATGATGVTPPLEGIEGDGVMQLRTVDDALDLEARIDSGLHRAVVVGGGYVGLEVAEALVARGVEVTVLEQTDAMMAGTLDPDMADRVAASVRAAGVDLRLGDGVDGFELDGDGTLHAVRSTAGDPIEADVAVLGLGARPNVEIARAAGLPVGDAGGLVVDDRLHTPVDGVWAGGDCAESVHRVTGRAVVIALGTHANKHGRVIGTNVGGGTARFPGVLGTAVTKFGDTEIGRTGLTTEQAEEAGVDVEATTVDSVTRSGYYPGSSPITVKLLARRDDDRIVGAQVVGGPGSAKRIDTVATAMWAEMTAADLAMADVAYAPPFSPVWDPIVLAAGVAAGRREERS